MSALTTLWQILMVVYHLLVASHNACVAFVKVMQSVVEEAKQEAAELTTLLYDGASTLDMITSPSLGRHTKQPENPWQMLIIARASSFVLLVRLSKRRVLLLEVDESFIMDKLEVIQTELTLHIQHIPRLLNMPIGTHDTRLVRYAPMKLPYLWRETAQVGVEGSIVATIPCANEDGKGRIHRKKYVQLLAESTLRRMQMDQFINLDAPQKKGMTKTQEEKKAKKKALANATNITSMHPDEPREGPAGASKTRTERGMHRTRSENSVNDTASQPLRRKRRQFDLYGHGVSGEFSLLPKN